MTCLTKNKSGNIAKKATCMIHLSAGEGEFHLLPHSYVNAVLPVGE